MELAGKRVVVFAEDLYDELEHWYPRIRMREAGAEVIVVGTGSSEVYRSKHGMEVKPETTADKIDASQVDAVIIPGGFAPDRLRRYPSVLKLVKDAYDQGKVVAAICHAGWVLASAGIVRGRKLTCVSAIKDDMVNAGAEYLDREVVRDGNLITSRTPADLPAFCRTIIAALAEKES